MGGVTKKSICYGTTDVVNASEFLAQLQSTARVSGP